MNVQRELIYSERRKALFEDNIHDSVLNMMEATINAVISRYSYVSEYRKNGILPH